MSFVIFDTEYTWRDDDPTFTQKEIIQIAAIRVDAQSLQVTDTMVVYVKPTIDPIIPQCEIDYTGITQQQVDEMGIPFPQAYAMFKQFVGASPCFSHGWSRDTTPIGDGEIMERNLGFNAMKDETPPYYLNIGYWFKEQYRKHGLHIEKQASCDVARLLGREDNLKPLGLGPHHALYDVYSLLEGVRHFQAEGLLPTQAAANT